MRPSLQARVAAALPEVLADWASVRKIAVPLHNTVTVVPSPNEIANSYRMVAANLVSAVRGIDRIHQNGNLPADDSQRLEGAASRILTALETVKKVELRIPAGETQS